VRLLDNELGSLAGEERSAKVCIPFGKIVRDGVDDTLWHLRAAWCIEENRGPSVDGLAQRGKLPAYPLDIQLAYFGGYSCAC
jgi:hypothetical protein